MPSRVSSKDSRSVCVGITDIAVVNDSLVELKTLMPYY